MALEGQSVLVSIARGLTRELNDATFSLPFEAERRYTLIDAAHDLADLHVSVIPQKVTIKTASRGKDVHEYEIMVGVQQQVDERDVEFSVDPLVYLSEQVLDWLRQRKRLEDVPEAAFTGASDEVTILNEHLQEHHLYTGVMVIKYEVYR